MKQTLPFFALIFLLTFNACRMQNSQKPTARFIAGSYNIRYDSPADKEAGNGWESRKERLLGQILSKKSRLIGMQEVTKGQLDWLNEQLTDYESVGVGREDGKTGGEYAPVFYDKTVFELLDSHTFWLSETPDRPSKSWDAAYPRIVTEVYLRHRLSKREFIFLNTHFDHIGTTARLKSAELILAHLQKRTDSLPLILCGDFNAQPDSPEYAVLAKSKLLSDARTLSRNAPTGPTGTFCTFNAESDSADFPQIDYFFINRKVKVHRFETIAEGLNGRYPSDHLFLVSEFILED